MVLIGKTGVGKSATGNSILGNNIFQSRGCMKSVTKICQRESGHACGRPVSVVDTPGLFDTSISNEQIQQEIMRCIELSAPGPHVFLLVIPVGPITQEERETLQLIKMTFGQKAETFTMVLFTRGDNLNDESIEDFIKEGDPHVQKLIQDCGGRFHVFNNRQKNPDQVVSLLKKIDKMMWKNDATFYNDKMFQEAEKTFRLKQINQEREEEVKREMEAIKAKYEAKLKKMEDKLEEEKAKKTQYMLQEREKSLLSKIDTEDQCEFNANFEMGTKGESTTDTSKKKKKRFSSFSSKDSKLREKFQNKKKCEVNKTTIQEEKCEEQSSEEIKNSLADQRIRKKSDIIKKGKTLSQGDQTASLKLSGEMHSPKYTEDEVHKNKLLHEQHKAMEDCKQKMEDIKKRYKEIEEIHAEEYRKMKKTHNDNIKTWEEKHGKNCVLQ